MFKGFCETKVPYFQKVSYARHLVQSIHSSRGSLFFRSLDLFYTYQSEPHIGLHDLVLLILQRIRCKDGFILHPTLLEYSQKF